MSDLSEAILRLKAEGKSYSEIQEVLGCSKGTISYHLGIGQKEKNLKRQRHRRNKVRAYVQEIKNATPCADCGESYPYWIMEFDHLDPGAKLFNISRTARAYTLEIAMAEIDKCDIVCANCHSNRTHSRLVRSTSAEIDELHNKHK